MILKKGDFIEDKFGQMQKTLIKECKDDPATAIELFDWFGSYQLVWSPSDSDYLGYPDSIPMNLERRVSVMVVHTRGK